jgi:hypothetical protein
VLVLDGAEVDVNSAEEAEHSQCLDTPRNQSHGMLSKRPLQRSRLPASVEFINKASMCGPKEEQLLYLAYTLYWQGI